MERLMAVVRIVAYSQGILGQRRRYRVALEDMAARFAAEMAPLLEHYGRNVMERWLLKYLGDIWRKEYAAAVSHGDECMVAWVEDRYFEEESFAAARRAFDRIKETKEVVRITAKAIELTEKLWRYVTEEQGTDLETAVMLFRFLLHDASKRFLDATTRHGSV